MKKLLALIAGLSLVAMPLSAQNAPAACPAGKTGPGMGCGMGKGMGKGMGPGNGQGQQRRFGQGQGGPGKGQGRGACDGTGPKRDGSCGQCPKSAI